jgi:hypothetical protein
VRRVLTAHRFHPTGPAVTQVLLLQQESREGRKRVAQLEKDTKELQRSEAAARGAAVESELLHTDALRVAEQLEVTRTTPLTPSPRLQLHPAAAAHGRTTRGGAAGGDTHNPPHTLTPPPATPRSCCTRTHYAWRSSWR